MVNVAACLRYASRMGKWRVLAIAWPLLRGVGGGGGILFHFILSKTVDGVVVVNRNVSHYLDHQRFSRI